MEGGRDGGTERGRVRDGGREREGARDKVREKGRKI